MEKRRFGRTNHMSTVAIFGTAAIGKSSQAEADQAMELILKHGVNHIDVAPSYGEAELRLASWMKSHRDQFFLGCKTTERNKKGAKEEMMRSFERMGTDHFDLYQLHAVTTIEKLDAVTRSGGALEAIVQAKEEGLTKYIGITGHGPEIANVLLEALQRFDFDTVLFPLNAVLLGIPEYGDAALKLLQQCAKKDVGVMIIKSITKGPWGDKPRTHAPWYEPFTEKNDIQRSVSFALSYEVTGICTVSDTSLLPLVIEACEDLKPMSEEEREAVIEDSKKYKPIFSPPDNS
jgi:aryl-alcohol dehydrogenase-like predicted oxidoreductase